MKRHIRIPSSALIGLALCLAQPALALAGSKPVGSLEATLDGQPYTGNTLEVASEGTSTAHFKTIGPMTMITVQAHDPKAKGIMHNVITLEMSVAGKDAAATVTPGAVAWWPKGMRGTFYINEGNETETKIELDAFSMGSEGHIKGRFFSTICRKDSMFAAADTSDCLPVEGRFDTALQKSD